jgi:hypothetical protein
MQDFEGQRLVERIAHYAVMELAVRWRYLERFIELTTYPDICFLPWIHVPVHSSDVHGLWPRSCYRICGVNWAFFYRYHC